MIRRRRQRTVDDAARKSINEVIDGLGVMGRITAAAIQEMSERMRETEKTLRNFEGRLRDLEVIESRNSRRRPL